MAPVASQICAPGTKAKAILTAIDSEAPLIAAKPALFRAYISLS